jgi:hypothetical protein
MLISISMNEDITIAVFAIPKKNSHEMMMEMDSVKCIVITWKAFGVDLRGFLDILKKDNVKVRLNLLVYNLLDRLDDQWVHSQTGRAYTDILRGSDLNSHHSNFNEYIDRVQDPSMFPAPRMVKAG